MELYALNNTVRRRLYMLYLLNLADWICTMALVGTGRFYEVNPLMRPFVGSLPMGLAVKCALPAVIVAVILRLSSFLDADSVSLVNKFTTVILILYAALCVNHIANFITLFLG